MFFFGKLHKLARIFRGIRITRPVSFLANTLTILGILFFSTSAILADSESDNFSRDGLSYHEEEVERVFAEDSLESFAVEMASWEEPSQKIETIDVAEEKNIPSPSNAILIQSETLEILSIPLGADEVSALGFSSLLEGFRFCNIHSSETSRNQNRGIHFTPSFISLEETSQGRAVLSGKAILKLSNRIAPDYVSQSYANSRGDIGIQSNDVRKILSTVENSWWEVQVSINSDDLYRIESREENRIVRMGDKKKLSLWLPNQHELHSINYSTQCESLPLKSMIMRSASDWKFLCLQARTIYPLAQSRPSSTNL
jgi:hypothetical protein